jgi:hypothetical protein
MTDDFKSKIITYLCGKYEIQNKEDKPTIEQIKETTNNFTDNLKAELKKQGHEVYRLYIYGSFQSKNASDAGLDKTLIYGVVDDINRELNGYIVIVDVGFNIIQVITKYSSGVKIDRMLKLEADETGNLMAIERYGEGLGTLRFLLLNNPTVKLPSDAEYKLIIKKSYEFPSNLRSYAYDFIRRRIGGGNYLFGGTNTTATGKFPIAVELTINVGAENEWKLFESDSSFGTSVSYAINDMWQTWDNENNLDFQMIGISSDNMLSVYNKNGDNISLTSINVLKYSEKLIVSNVIRNISKIKQKNNFYSIIYQYTFEKGSTNKYALYEIFNIKDGVVANIYKNQFVLDNYLEEQDYGGLGMSIKGNDVNIFMLCYTNISVYTLYIGRIANNQVYLVEKDNISQSVSNPIIFYNVTKQFNLYNYQFQLINLLYSTLEIYNENNYNGLPYQDLDSMVPNSGILYNSSNIPIFARNLYNKTISGRTTQSTIEVPNIYLNDDIITKENLLGKTNSILISNSETIVKNIYETLNINFINTLQIRNDNDEVNPILNPVGASRLNNSISETTDYNNMKALKVKINFTDNTNYIIQLNANQIYKISDTSYIYDFDIYASKDITNIQIISNDEITVYQTITSIFIADGFYNITQMVEIV